MIKRKIKAWLKGTSARAVVSWIELNSTTIRGAVRDEAPDQAELFITHIDKLLYVSEGLPIEDVEMQLASGFHQLPASVEAKLEMRFRSYQNRRNKLFNTKNEAPQENVNTWVTIKQTDLVLTYLYQKMNAVRLRPGLFETIENELAFQSAIFSIYGTYNDDISEVNAQLNEAIKEHLTLSGWRELKHTIRSYRHIQENKLVSIKIDTNAKHKLEKYKLQNNLSSISEAIHSLLGRLK